MSSVLLFPFTLSWILGGQEGSWLLAFARLWTRWGWDLHLSHRCDSETSVPCLTDGMPLCYQSGWHSSWISVQLDSSPRQGSAHFRLGSKVPEEKAQWGGSPGSLGNIGLLTPLTTCLGHSYLPKGHLPLSSYPKLPCPHRWAYYLRAGGYGFRFPVTCSQQHAVPSHSTIEFVLPFIISYFLCSCSLCLYGTIIYKLSVYVCACAYISIIFKLTHLSHFTVSLVIEPELRDQSGGSEFTGSIWVRALA